MSFLSTTIVSVDLAARAIWKSQITFQTKADQEQSRFLLRTMRGLEVVHEPDPDHLKDQNAMPYVYQPIDKTAHGIRLLELLPGYYNEKIRCKMRHFTLSDCPEYWAVSYTWGMDPPEESIEIDTFDLPVRSNLFAFLRRARLTYANLPLLYDGNPVLWIDAICIDQASELERNHQVQQMGEIYRKAAGVFAWVGEPEMVDISTLAKFHRPTGSIVGKGTLSKFSLSNFDHMRRFCAREYWHRTWIQQEVILARRVAICCGDFIVPWEKFVDICQPSPDSRDETLRSASPEDVESFRNVYFPGTVLSRLMKQRKLRRNRLPPLLELLDKLQSETRCTDKRDRVYSLLGLAGDCNERDGLRPDYSMSAPSLFLEVMAFCEPPDVCAFGKLLSEILQLKSSDFVSETRGNFTHADGIIYSIGRLPKLQDMRERNQCRLPHGVNVSLEYIHMTLSKRKTMPLSPGDEVYGIRSTDILMIYRPPAGGRRFVAMARMTRADTLD